MKFLVLYHLLLCSIPYNLFIDRISQRFVRIFSTVKYEARLEDGRVVSKSDGVEFTVRDGMFAIIFCNCCVVLVFKSEFLMQKYFVSSRCILPCHIKGCQNYEEKREGPPHCQATM